jgi:GntR family transcriptional regulator
VPERESDRPLYRRLADELRARIASGEFPPGSLLPSESELAVASGMSRDTVRDALALLRAEGLVTTRRGQGTRTRDSHPVGVVRVSGSASVHARMPTPEERERLDLLEGVPLLVVRTAKSETVYGGDRTVIRWGGTAR